MSKKQNDEFLGLIGKLSPVEFYGLARVMGVQIMKEKDAEGAPALKSGETLLFDVVATFPTLRRPVRKQIIEMLKEMKHDGFSTKN